MGFRWDTRVRERGIETRGGRERGGRVAFPFLGPVSSAFFLGSGGCFLVCFWVDVKRKREGKGFGSGRVGSG